MIGYREGRFDEWTGYYVIREWEGWAPPKSIDDAAILAGEPAPEEGPWGDVGRRIADDPAFELKGEVRADGSRWWIYGRPEGWFHDHCGQ